MKKLATLGVLCAVAGVANAQSTVTVFGIVDAAVRNVKNGDNSVKSLASGGFNSSRLGFNGVEELGAGLRANFWLEHGFNVDTGSVSDAARFWNRRATVGLSGGFGEVRLGRDFTPTYTTFSNFDPFGDNGVAAGGKFFNTLGTNVDTNTRSDNLVSYFLPADIGGVYGQASVAAGEGTNGKKYIGARVGYRAGAVNAAVAYGQTEVSWVTPGVDKYKVLAAGASYDFGVVKLSGYFDQKKYASLNVRTANLGVQVPIGPGYLRAGYTRVDASGNLRGAASISPNDASQLAVGYVYNLSKRTALYGTAARVDNKARATYVTNAVPALPNPNTGRDSTGIEFGIRHSF